jgi:hypothetical protein
MCSQGAFGGALRCPVYCRDFPRPALIEALHTQFARKGYHFPELPPEARNPGRVC